MIVTCCVLKGIDRKIMRTLFASLSLVFLLTLPVEASAQVWLADRSDREGPGIRLGDSLIFHPGLGAEGGYDTNALRRSDAAGAGRMRITPYLDLATRSKKRLVENEGVVSTTPSKVSFRLGIAGYYDWYFADELALDKQDDFGIDTSLNFVLFPMGKFSLILDAAYLRTLEPYESPEENWARQSVKPGIGFRLRPGGGTLTFEAGYGLDWMFFEDDEVAKQDDRMTHNVRFVTSWKILPKTALISRTVFSPVAYLGDSSKNENSMPVRSWLGIQGLLTPRFGLELHVGYGASFYDSGDDFDSILAKAELKFFVTPFANIRLGGERNFVDSFYANFYSNNGGYLKYEHIFGGIFLASLKGSAYYRDYSESSGIVNGVEPSHEERADTFIGATLLLEIRATEWLSFHASAQYQQNITDFAYITDDNPDTVDITEPYSENYMEFNKFLVFGGVRFHY
jgi:hypothetical protein